jgi:hypothetical protein
VPLPKHAPKLAHSGFWDNPTQHSTNDVILFDGLYNRVEEKLAAAITKRLASTPAS